MNTLLRCLCMTLLAVTPLGALAQTYPTKPVRVVVPFPPAGASDILARVVSQKLSETMGRQFIVDNRPGAGANIGANIASKAPPDGYTLLLGAVTNHAVSMGLYSKLPYDLEKDLAPVALLANVQHMLVAHPSLPVKSVRDVVALAKARPGQLNWASQGNGTLSHLEMELFRSLAGIDVTHIPYKGSAEAMPNLLAGQVVLFFDAIPASLPHVKSGRLRAIAVAATKRSAALPDIATVAESGLKGFEANNWFGIMAPKGMPDEIVAKLNAEIVKAVNAPDVKEKMYAQGAEMIAGSPAELGKVVHAEVVKWAKVIKDAGVRLE